MIIQRIAIDNMNWTPVIVPKWSGNIWLRNDGDDTKIRTDSNDPNTEDVLKTTIQLVSNTSYYNKDEVFCYVKQANNATGTLIAYFG